METKPNGPLSTCPTCGAPAHITWSGLDLVAESGDETLAERHYEYATSRVQALEEELAHEKSVVRALKDAMINGTDLFDSIYFEGEPKPKARVLEEENKRLQERLSAADSCLEVWSWSLELKMTILEWKEECRNRLEKYNSLKK